MPKLPKPRTIAAGLIAIGTPLLSACLPGYEHWKAPIDGAVVRTFNADVTCYDVRLGGINIGAASRRRIAQGLPAITASGADYRAGESAAVDPRFFNGLGDMRARAKDGTSLWIVFENDFEPGVTPGDIFRRATDTGGAIKGNGRIDMSAPTDADRDYCSQWGRQGRLAYVVDPRVIDARQLTSPVLSPL